MRTFAIVLGACWIVSIVSAQEPHHAWSVPTAADGRVNPLANRRDLLDGGKKVFRERCAACHREDGTGTSRGANLMTAAVQKQSDGALFWKISSGNTRTGMPSFSFLPEPQRWQLVSYLRSLAD